MDSVTAYTLVSHPSLHVNKRGAEACLRWCVGGVESVATINQATGEVITASGPNANFLSSASGYLKLSYAAIGWDVAFEVSLSQGVVTFYTLTSGVATTSVNGLLGATLRTQTSLVASTFVVPGNDLCAKYSIVASKDAYVC